MEDKKGRDFPSFFVGADVMSKEVLRKELREKRNLLCEKDTKSQKITGRLLASEVFQNAEYVPPDLQRRQDGNGTFRIPPPILVS